jgi:hypothetical protein
MYQSGAHLLVLIADVLDLAKVESGRIELAPELFHFPGFLREIAEMFRLRAAEKGLTFELAAEAPELPGWVRCDERRLRQVLLRRFRADPDFADLPIIATSASVFAENRRKCLETGADRFFPKPVDAGQLLATLGEFLDLEWIYADGAGPESDTETGRPVEAVPEPAVLSGLLDLAESGDLAALEEKLAEIAAEDIRYEPLAERPGKMARNFEMNRIRSDLRERLK